MDPISTAAISGSFNVLFDRVAPEIKDEFLRCFRGNKVVDELRRKLVSRLNLIKPLAKIAEEKQFTDQDAKNWFDECNYVINEAQLLVEGEDGSTSRAGKIRNFFPFIRTAVDELNKILEMLGALLERGDQLRLILGVQNVHWRNIETPILSESHVYGRDQDKEKIIHSLLSDHLGGENLFLIHIVGMCGSGKKTLAHFVYQDPRVQVYFDLKGLFTLSKETTTLEVLKLILEKVTDRPCNTEEPYQLQSELSAALSGNKFLFVLLNVWEENGQLWEVLLNACQSGAAGSRMIMTMRSRILASSMPNVEIHELQLLSDDDCFKILARYVFPYVDIEALSHLKQIGTEIVHECQGLPLAVKSIGGVLRNVTYGNNVREMQVEWGKIRDEDIWKLQFEENQRSNILPPLLSSYLSLSPELKRCLAVFRLYPKGYQFRECDGKTLIWLWRALGLLNPDTGKRMEDVGKAYLEALISKSFFQYSSASKHEFKMHNLVHDFIGRISKEFYCACGDSTDFSTLGKVYHLSYEKEDVLRQLASLSETKSLRILLALPLSSNSGGNNQVPLSSGSGVNNQVPLTSNSGGNNQVPLSSNSGGNNQVPLSSNSGGNNQVPLSSNSGGNNQVPLSSNSGGNNQVPLSSNSGGNNQVLEKSHLDDLFRQVRFLKFLSQSKSSATEIPDSIKKSKHLTCLDVSHSQVKRISDKVCSLPKLQALILSGCTELRDLPSKLAKLVNLLHLDIRGTSVEKMPPHMGNMKNLETLSDFILSKDEGWRIKELAGLQRLGGSLRIEGLETIVDINDAGAANLKDKKFLHELILIWKSDSGASHQEVLNVLRPHTNLERLTIEGYRGTQLPDWVEGLNVLSCLIIKGCPELVQRCQRGTGDDWSKIQHIPTIYIDDQLI